MALNRHLWRIYTDRLLYAAVVGVVFGLAMGGLAMKPALLGAGLGAMSGLIDVTALMAIIGGAETFLPRTRLGRALARAPFLVAIAVKTAAYLAVVVAVVGGRLGPNLALLTVDADTAQLLAAQLESNLPRRLLIPVTTLVVFLLVVLRQATLLVGERTMRDIVLGRYRRPRTEERFSLFVDIVGSTPVAERLGPVSVHHYLSRVFLLASDPIDQNGGAVVQYVGDEVIVTWKLAEGRGGARPLACLFAIEAAVAAAAADFEREFSTIPRLRAALHAGEVVTGETGGSRRAIVFNGDVMNTTSRIENATRTLGRPYLVSEDALKRMQGTEAYALEDMGPQQLRGKEARLRVFAVSLPGR